MKRQGVYMQSIQSNSVALPGYAGDGGIKLSTSNGKPIAICLFARE